MALPSWLLAPVDGRRSQRLGPSPTLESLGSSHQRRHKSQVSLEGPPCVHGVSDTPHGEVRDMHNAPSDSDKKHVKEVPQKNWLSAKVCHLSMLSANVTSISKEMLIWILSFFVSFCKKKKSMTPPLSHMVLPPYAKSVAQIMATSLTPIPQCRSKWFACLSHIGGGVQWSWWLVYIILRLFYGGLMWVRVLWF